MSDKNILTFLNNHFCLNHQHLSNLFRQLKKEYAEDYADELENAIYEFYRLNKNEMEDEG